MLHRAKFQIGKVFRIMEGEAPLGTPYNGVSAAAWHMKGNTHLWPLTYCNNVGGKTSKDSPRWLCMNGVCRFLDSRTPKYSAQSNTEKDDSPPSTVELRRSVLGAGWPAVETDLPRVRTHAFSDMGIQASKSDAAMRKYK